MEFKAIDQFLSTLKESKEFKETIAKKKEEFENLKDCIFKPTINRNDQHLKNVLYGADIDKTVKGLNRFMLNVERAKDIKDEKLARENKVFLVNPDYDYEKKKYPTVPVPFNLSEGKER